MCVCMCLCVCVCVCVYYLLRNVAACEDHIRKHITQLFTKYFAQKETFHKEDFSLLSPRCFYSAHNKVEDAQATLPAAPRQITDYIVKVLLTELIL
jgi:hypothetical protein